jgi:maleamate amidohydrolase
MSDAYADAGFSSAFDGLGSKPAVLVVDLQFGFTDPRFPLGRSAMVQAATDNTARLLAVARAHRVPVAKCFTAYRSIFDMPRWRVKAMREEFWYGSPGTAMDPRIHDERYDFTFCKSAPSIFFLTPLLTFLVKQQVDTVLITGCNTSGCIRASIVDAFSYGLRVAVPGDCCGDPDRAAHEANLGDCARRYCDVTDLQSMQRYLEAMA